MSKTFCKRLRTPALRLKGLSLRASLILACGFWLLVSTAFAQSFSLSLDRDTITLGEHAVLLAKFEGVDNPGNFDLPTIPYLEFGTCNPSTQQSIMIVNGEQRVSSTITLSFTVTPKRVGQYNFPAQSVSLKGQTYLSQPFSLRVLPPLKVDGQDVINGTFLKLTASRTNVYVGELIEVELQVFYQSISQYEPPHFNEQGFTLGKEMRLTPTGSTVIDGRQYSVAALKTIVTPVKAGPLNLGPATMQVTIPAKDSPRDFFGRIASWQTVTLESNPQILNVSPLPSDNVPATFTGAVGTFRMNVSATPTNVAVGDPITIKIQVSGNGNLENLVLPAQSTAWNDFKLYPPTSQYESGDQLSQSGSKTFSLTAVPQSLEIKELPPYDFSYFNPRSKKYETLSRPAIPLTIRPSAASLPMPTQMNTTAAPETSSTNELAPLKQRPGTLVDSFVPLITRKWFLTVEAVPVLAWMTLLVRRKQAQRLANNPRLRRHLAVEKMIHDGLAALPAFAEAGQVDEFFATLFHLLQERLGERLDLPASGITESALDLHAAELALSTEQSERAHLLFQRCDQARYAKVADRQELLSLIAELQTALNDLKLPRA